jgi:hypothetical protein
MSRLELTVIMVALKHKMDVCEVILGVRDAHGFWSPSLGIFSMIPPICKLLSVTRIRTRSTLIDLA